MANGNLELYNGSNWVTLGSGTITSITAGNGLAGGTITTTGTVSLAPSGVVAGTYNNTSVTVDVYGRIIAAANGSGGTGGSINSILGTVNQITVGGTITDPIIAFADNPVISGNGFIGLPVGTTAQRPVSPQRGYFRFNTDL